VNSARALDDAILFFGQTNPAQCRIYAALDSDAPGLALGGTITGPHCPYAETLEATFPLNDRPGGDSLLAHAWLSDPCFWTPELPYLYSVTLELHDSGKLIETQSREFGIRPLAARGRNLMFNGQRWVLRGLWREGPTRPLSDWHAADTAMVARDPDESLCTNASRIGVLLVAQTSASGEALAVEIRRLAKWPAIGLIIIDPNQLGANERGQANCLRCLAPNMLFAQRMAAGNSIVPQAWADLAFCEIDLMEDLGSQMSATTLPIVAAITSKPHASVAAGRAQSDRLQRDLAHIGDFSGYVA